MTACRICKKVDCDDDCEELALIYRQQQREKLADLADDGEEPRCRCGWTTMRLCGCLTGDNCGNPFDN